MRTGETERRLEARDRRLKRILVSMRSMDDSGNHPDDFPPGGDGEGGGGGGGGGGRRHVIRPRSPTSSYYFEDPDQQSKPRFRLGGHQQRRGHGQGQGQGQGGDPKTDEIIRFVRGYQLERESTWLRLQKKAPLPGIGQVTHSLPDPNFPPTFEERRYMDGDDDDDRNNNDNDDECGNDDDDEDYMLDSEVSAIEGGHRDPLRHQVGLGEDLRFSSSLPAGARRHDRLLRTNASYGPPANQPRHAARPLDNRGHAMRSFSPKARGKKRWGRPLKQLPPIARDELPERPSAPSPSLTPPGEGEEELDSAGEPVDFIDAA